MMTGQEWELAGPHGSDGWSVTNTSGRLAKEVYIQFEGVVAGQRWREGITPVNVETSPGRVTPGETIRINIHSSETVDKVSIQWKAGFRTKTWSTTDI